MAFADMFSAENVGNLMQDPRMALGLALMSQGRQGSSSQALGQGGLGASQMIQQSQHAQQLAQYRQQQMAAMQQQQAMQQQAAQGKQDQLQRQQAALQDPAVLDQLGPMARAMAANGVDIGSILRGQGIDNLQAHRQASLQQQQSQFDTRQYHTGGGQPSGPRQRALPTLIPEHLPNNMIQDHKLNPKTGEFEPFGAPYSKYAPGRAKTNQTVDAVADELAPAPEQGPGLGALPGTGGLASYAPQSSGPVGVMPMTAAGSVAAPKTAATAAQGAATPKSQADYDALPAGARYVDPVSGKIAVKRG